MVASDILLWIPVSPLQKTLNTMIQIMDRIIDPWHDDVFTGGMAYGA